MKTIPKGLKAVIFDLDGTALPSLEDGKPSEPVIKAIKKAKKSLKVSAATGRSQRYALPVLKELGLTDPCIIAGGSRIIDPQTSEILWQQILEVDALTRIIELSDSSLNLFFDNKQIFGLESFDLNIEVNIAYIEGLTIEQAQELSNKLRGIPNVALHTTTSWTTGAWDLHITHHLGTKEHGIKKLLEFLGVKKEEVLGVGDSGNDLPLFRSVGFKVAMGNATEELKKEADFIAPTLKEDGLAKIINEMLSS